MKRKADTTAVTLKPQTIRREKLQPDLRLVISEFQPDAAEIAERPPPFAAKITLYVLLALIVTTIAWASLSRIDMTVVALGKMTTNIPNIVVQPLETSIVRAIEAAPGDTVNAGQILARLDPTFPRSDREQLQLKSAALDARIARLEAELDGRKYELGQEASPEQAVQAKLFVQRKAAFDAQYRNLNEQISRAKASLVTNRGEQMFLKKRLETVREIEQMRIKLFDLKSGSRLNLLQSIDQRLEMESSLGRFESNQIEMQHAVEKAKAEQESFREDFLRKALEELIEAREERKSTTEQLKKVELRENMVVLTTPADAVVLDVAQRSIGSVVREAEPLFTLVPMNVPIEAEVLIEARDIGLVKVGQAVRLKFDTFPFQLHGTAEGFVRTISQDSFAPQQRPDNPGGAAPHFRARVEVTSTALRALPSNFRPLPGMTVTGDIKVGDRTIISYFLYPILRALDESIREP